MPSLRHGGIRSRHEGNARVFNAGEAAIVDPQFIVGVRKKLKLDQCEAAELFGGVNAFILSAILLAESRRSKRDT